MRNTVELGVGHRFRGLQTANTLGWLLIDTCMSLRGQLIIVTALPCSL